MTKNYMTCTYLNKEVQIYPGDTYSKYGIIREINEQGVVFEITRSRADEYKVGDIIFISFSARLSFKLVKE